MAQLELIIRNTLHLIYYTYPLFLLFLKKHGKTNPTAATSPQMKVTAGTATYREVLKVSSVIFLCFRTTNLLLKLKSQHTLSDETLICDVNNHVTVMTFHP